MIRETGEVTASLASAVADGGVSEREARELRRQADEAIVVLQEFTAQLNALLQEARR